MRAALLSGLLGLGLVSLLVSACATGSSGGASRLLTGTCSAESGGSTLSAQTGDCGMNPLFNIDAHNIARRASQFGVGPQATPPLDALHAVLTRGSEPFFGGSGGSGVVAMVFPAAG
jgi:hypothetical protein